MLAKVHNDISRSHSNGFALAHKFLRAGTIGLLCKLMLFTMLSPAKSVNYMGISFMLLDASLFPLLHTGLFYNGPLTWLVRFILVLQVDIILLSQLIISLNG